MLCTAPFTLRLTTMTQNSAWIAATASCSGFDAASRPDSGLARVPLEEDTRRAQDAAMNEEQALAEIVRTLTVDHGCHAVILYGSPARGDFQPTSDWEVAGIRENRPALPRRAAPRVVGR